VFTSRDLSAAELASDGLLLEMMKPKEFKSLLISRAGLINSNEKELRDVNIIVEALSHLPLAIDQAGAFIRARKCSPASSGPATYIRQFEGQRERILKFSLKLSSYNKSVITTWEVSFKRLKADSLIAAKLLLIFCFLDSKRISEGLINDVTKSVLKMNEADNENETIAEDNDVNADLVDLMMNPDGFDAIIERMIALSLVREHTETVEEQDTRIFSLHPLIAYCDRSRAGQLQKKMPQSKLFVSLATHSQNGREISGTAQYPKLELNKSHFLPQYSRFWPPCTLAPRPLLSISGQAPRIRH